MLFQKPTGNCFSPPGNAGRLEGHTFLSSYTVLPPVLPMSPKQKQKQKGNKRYPLLFERLAVRLGLYPRMVEEPVSYGGIFRGVTHLENGAEC
jgi:hypothetical protein